MVLNLDAFIDSHLHITKFKDNKRYKYQVEDLHELCNISTAMFKSEPSLVRINPPCIVVGDIHGQYFDLLRMFSMYTISGQNSGALTRKFVFLGDYVDRGTQSLECICLILALKNRFPTKYMVLRGNHENESICSVYGFRKELIERLGDKAGLEVFAHFTEMFSWMPLAGLIGSKILCMHGGISPKLTSLKDIEMIERPIKEVNQGVKLALDLLWADPKEGIMGYRHNTMRDVSVFFGESEVNRVCNDLDIRLIIRGHQMMSSGFASFANRKLVTVFTAPRYQKDNPNAGATIEIVANGHIGVHILDPNPDEPTETTKDESGGLDLLGPMKKKSEDEKSIEAKKSEDGKKSEISMNSKGTKNSKASRKAQAKKSEEKKASKVTSKSKQSNPKRRQK